jgi:hypothetical protein
MNRITNNVHNIQCRPLSSRLRETTLNFPRAAIGNLDASRPRDSRSMIRNSGQGAKRRAIVKTRTVTMPAGRWRTQRHPTGPGGCTARPPVRRGSSDGRAVRPADGPKSAAEPLCCERGFFQFLYTRFDGIQTRGPGGAAAGFTQNGNLETSPCARASRAGGGPSKSHSCRRALARFATGSRALTSADVADLPAGESPPRKAMPVVTGGIAGRNEDLRPCGRRLLEVASAARSLSDPRFEAGSRGFEAGGETRNNEPPNPIVWNQLSDTAWQPKT